MSDCAKISWAAGAKDCEVCCVVEAIDICPEHLVLHCEKCKCPGCQALDDAYDASGPWSSPR